MPAAPATWATADEFQPSRSQSEGLERAGVQTVITPCAECFHTFSRKYPASSGVRDSRSVHMVQFVDQLIK